MDGTGKGGAYLQNDLNECDNHRNTDELHLFRSIHEMAESLGQAVDAKDPMTRAHSQQVADMAYCLASEMGISAREAEAIHIAGHLHDIGKIGIPDAVLCKNGPLTPDEWQQMCQHPTIGARIVSPVQSMNGTTGIANMILYHHERWDGRGYPQGLKGEQIPRGARVLALADSFSAMMENRTYRSSLTPEKTLEELRRGSADQFDPQICAVMISMLLVADFDHPNSNVQTVLPVILKRRKVNRRLPEYGYHTPFLKAHLEWLQTGS